MLIQVSNAQRLVQCPYAVGDTLMTSNTIHPGNRWPNTQWMLDYVNQFPMGTMPGMGGIVGGTKEHVHAVAEHAHASAAHAHTGPSHVHASAAHAHASAAHVHQISANNPGSTPTAWAAITMGHASQTSGSVAARKVATVSWTRSITHSHGSSGTDYVSTQSSVATGDGVPVWGNTTSATPGNTGSTTPGATGAAGTGATGSTTPGATGSAGGGSTGSMAHIPPYKSTYFWTRTA